MKQPKGVKLGHRALIVWVDSTSLYGWQNADDYQNTAEIGTVVSIGIIVKFSKKSISISTSAFLNSTAVNSILTIPWCSIETFKQYENIVLLGE